MRCFDCGHQNVPGSLFCEQCGADLATPAETPAVPTVDNRPETHPCPSCGHRNPTGFTVCEACGRRLPTAEAAPAPPEPEPPVVPTPQAQLEAERAAVPQVDEPQERKIEPVASPAEAPDTPPPPRVPEPLAATQPMTPGQLVTGPQRGKVKLVVEQGMVVGKQFILANDQMVVGREDPSENLYPDIDLTGLDEGYVHRRHAKLSFEGSFLFVTHLGGHNRTYVNNRPIADHLAHPLNIGDTVRFGKVVMRLTEA